MRYLKLFEDFETETKNKYSVTFDERFFRDVTKSLKEKGFEFEEVESIYWERKKERELHVWAKSNLEIIKVIPSFVKHLQVQRQK